MAVPTPDAAAFLLEHIDELADGQGGARRSTCATRVRYAGRRTSSRCAKLMQEKFADDLDLQLELFQSIRQKAAASAASRCRPRRSEWGAALGDGGAAADGAEPTLDDVAARPRPPADSPSPWGFSSARACDGDQRVAVLQQPARRRAATRACCAASRSTMPSKLTFFLAGHNGPPQRRRDRRRTWSACARRTDDAVLDRSVPPRNDIAPQGRVGPEGPRRQAGVPRSRPTRDTGTGYAWLAFGRFDPPVVTLPSASPAMIAAQQRQAAEIAAALTLKRSSRRRCATC